MTKRIKEYLEYRKNKKIAKREFAKMMATTLPVIHEVSDKGVDIAKFITKLSTETKSIKGEKFIKLVLDELSSLLKSNNKRIVEIFTYLVSMSPEDIQKVLVHSMVETMDADN